MKKRKIIGGVILVLTAAALFDMVRYLKPGAREKTQVLSQNTILDSADKIILVYNAYGGIYPGLADFVHKIVFPSTYPCRLCDLSFGTFEMKEDWRRFLDRLPYPYVELHKDDFQRNYEPSATPLPAILSGRGKRTKIFVSASEINGCNGLEQLKALVAQKIRTMGK